MLKQKGTLYLVATPIGNLEDITLRALKVLKEVDLIGAEDTRTSKKLLSHYEINTPLTSYHDHNQQLKGKQLIEKLQEGINIAIITDAGLPGISDPGSDLVRLAVEQDITVVPIPGANAALTALVASGINTDRFLFHGFLPRKKKEREEQLSALKDEPRTIIIYEAPHRLKETLKSMSQHFAARKIAVAREMTKKFEQFIRGTPEQVLQHFNVIDPRGEITIILEGRKPSEKLEEELKPAVDPIEAINTLVQAGQSKKEAIKQVAKETGVNRRELYEQMLIAEGKK